MIKSTKEIAVNILNEYGFSAKYNKDFESINIYGSSLSDPVTIHYSDISNKLSMSFSSSNTNLKNQKKVVKKIQKVIEVLEKIKRIDPSLVE